MLRWWRRGRLASEILLAYIRVRRRLARENLPAVLDGLRGQAREFEFDDEARRRNYWRALNLARAVQRVLRIAPLDDRCLTQSLVLTRLLARRRISSTLLIAVRTGGDAVRPKRDFVAHAWVEHSGRPLLPDGDESYELLARL